jgi:hypothetical protein
LKFVNNDISQESISLGLVVISGQNLFYKVSQEKINVANKLNPDSKKLLDFALKNLEKHFDFNKKGLELFSPKHSEYLEYLLRLANYNNGILQFSPPSQITKEFDKAGFQHYFEKLVFKNELDQELLNKPSKFQVKIKEKLHIPLREQIDVNYTLKQHSLPSLFFDFHFDGLGYNGAMYGIKSIDFNANKKLANIKAEIAEFESVIKRLNKFAQRQEINGDPKYFLLMDPYEGDKVSYADLYAILKNQDAFRLASSQEIEPIVKDIKKSKAKKFSDLLVTPTVVNN